MSRNQRRLGRRLGALTVLTALALMVAPAVNAAVPFGQAAFAGYATGTYLHVDALTIGTTPTVKLDAGFSGASVNSQGLTSSVTDGLGRVVTPAAGANLKSHAAGFGLDVNLLGGDLLAQQHVAAAAPPSTDLQLKRLLGPLTVPGVLSAGVLEGRAQSRYDDEACILGADMSYGQGDAADATLLGGPIAELTSALLGTDPGSQDAGAIRSSSRTRLVPQTSESGQLVGEHLALMAETRQTLAPVVLFQGIPGAEITINLLGEWVLRTVATGIPGQAYVQYQPGEATSGGTTVLSIQNTLPVVGQVTEIINVTLDQLLGLVPLNDLLGGPGGLLGLGLIDLELNPPPTITESADGRTATASVDVAKVTLLPSAEGILGQLTNSLIPGLELADVRIGHMEAAATVPEGGIECPDIKVTKTSDKNPVNAGDSFTYTIDVTNPYDCTLTNVKVVDTISTNTDRITYTVAGHNPPASSVSGNVVTWNDIGPIGPKESKQVTLTLDVGADSPAGHFINNVDVTANCGLTSAQGQTNVQVAVKGGTRVEIPTVQPQEVAPLPKTGGNNALYATGAVGLGLLSLLAAFGYRRLKPGSGGT